MDQIAQPEPSAPSKCGKWWHVSDEKIEELIHKKMALGDSMKNKAHAPAGALRNYTYSAKGNRSVNFREALQEKSTVAHAEVEDSLDQALRRHGQVEDSLDQAMREHASPVREKSEQQQVKGNSTQKPKSWKVPDERILDMVEAAANTLARDGENIAPIGRALAHYGKVIIGNDSDPQRNVSAHNSFFLQDCIGKSSRPVPGEVGVSKFTRHPSRKPGNSTAFSRPAWVSDANPRFFAGVGSGLDGKRNKTVKPEGAKFEEKPIYLSDCRDSSLSRVREAVCGHPFYMKR